MKLAFAAATLAAALVALPAAAATTYDAGSYFSAASNPSGPFTFGSFSSGVFTAFPTGGTCLFANTVCLTSGNYLGAYESADGVYHDSGTANIPATGLVLHPGQNGELSTILFTAPTTSTYLVTFSGYQADDNAQTQTYGAISAGVPITLGTLTTSNPTFALNGSILLTAGQQIGVYVGNDVNYFNDATGVTFTLTAVPEPATWGLMIAGFGMIGFGMRRRSPAAIRA